MTYILIRVSICIGSLSIMDSFDVNLGLVSSEQKNDGVVRYEIKIPFMTGDESQENIREDSLKIAREMNEYVDIDEDDIVGDCPRDGMGSYGPNYKCTRCELPHPTPQVLR